MAEPKKRVADEAFVEHESTVPQSKKRRRKYRSKSAAQSEPNTYGTSQAPPRKTSTIIQSTKSKMQSQILQSRVDHRNPPALVVKPESSTQNPVEEVKQVSKKGNRTRKRKMRANVEDGDDKTRAVAKLSSSHSPPKPKTLRWNLSQSVGGIFNDQDPILVDRDQYLVLPTAGGIQVYSTKSSLLVRSLSVRESDPITSCVLDPDDQSHLFFSRNGGMVERWDWMKGRREDQWQCQIDLLEIVAVVREASGQYKLLTLHGASEDEIKLMQTKISAGSVAPDDEVLLLSKEAQCSGYKSTDNAKVLCLAFGKKLVLGQLLPVSKGSDEKTYTWREVAVPEYVESIDVRTRDRSKSAGSSLIKILDVVVGFVDGAILVYEDLLYKLIGKEKGMKDIEIVSRRLHWHRQAVNALKWSKDGNYLVSGGNETVLVIWQLDTNQQQYLPHLSTPILNITISETGSSYVLRLADNSVMVLSTADLLPSANVSGLALSDDPNHPVLAVISPRDPSQILFAVHPDPLSGGPSSATTLQTFDAQSARQVSRQALTRNMTTAIRSAPDGSKVHEPNVTHLKLSHDGNWLITIEEWQPKAHDTDALHLAGHGQGEDGQTTETCLKFWKWQQEGLTWELVTRVDEPHTSGRHSVLVLITHPARLEASTVGMDGTLRKWTPMARHRDGVAVQDESGEALYTWICSKTTQLEPEPPIVNEANRTSAAVAYSEDGSAIAVSWSWSGVTNRVVHIVNARTGALSLTRSSILSAGPAQLAFVGKYLLGLSHKFCIWDTVTLKKTYSIVLQHTGRDGKFLAVNTTDGTFALGFDSREDMVPSSVAVFNAHNPQRGPVYQGKVHGHVKVMLPYVASAGYLLVDSNARIRHLTPPGFVRPVALLANAKNQDVTKGLRDIFGAKGASTSMLEGGTSHDDQLIPSLTEGHAEQKSLDGVLSSITSSKLPSVRQMFEQVASLFARKTVAAE